MGFELFNKLYRDIEQENYSCFLDFMENDKHATVIDFGCGSGDFTLQIGTKIGTTKLYGVEIQKSAIQICKNKGIVAECFDLNDKIPLEDSTFDVVCASQVIEHLSHTDIFIKEIYRILKPGGYAVISTPNLAVWHNLICIFLGWQLFGTGVSDEITVGNPFQLRYNQQTSEGLGFAHSRVFTLRALKELFKFHNFIIEKSIGVGYFPFPIVIGKLFSKADPRHSLLLTMKVRKI